MTADGKTLAETQQRQDDRRRDADRRIGRQQSDQGGRDAHQRQRDHEGPLAADAVAEMAEHDAAEGPRDESEGKGAEGKDQRDGRRTFRKEDGGKNERGGGRVKEKVIPFDAGARQRRKGDGTHVLFEMSFRFLYRGGSTDGHDPPPFFIRLHHTGVRRGRNSAAAFENSRNNPLLYKLIFTLPSTS